MKFNEKRSKGSEAKLKGKFHYLYLIVRNWVMGSAQRLTGGEHLSDLKII